jgi:hypothetical protein
MTRPSKDHLAHHLEQTRDALLRWAQSRHESDWTQPIYSHDGDWTTLDVFRHLAWAEGGMTRLIQQIRQGEGGVPVDFDLDRYNATGVRKLSDKTPAELLEMMAQNRTWTLQLLEELDKGEMQMQGRHGSMRVMTVAEIFDLIADHEHQHLQEMQRALGRD